jgi:hypothetical protein
MTLKLKSAAAGSEVAEVAHDLVALCRGGDLITPGKLYFAPEIVSIEPSGENSILLGRQAAIEKDRWWGEANELHGLEVFGPYLNRDQFTVRFVIDATARATGARRVTDEIGLFTVRDGRIVEERFFQTA